MNVLLQQCEYRHAAVLLDNIIVWKSGITVTSTSRVYAPTQGRQTQLTITWSIFFNEYVIIRWIKFVSNVKTIMPSLATVMLCRSEVY